MCPMCISTALLMVGSATSSGGLAAIAITKLGRKTTKDHANDAGNIAPK
jgi:hypothetical protein